MNSKAQKTKSNPTRKTKADDIEAARQARARQESLPSDVQIQAKLNDLLAFISHLEKTDYGRADLQRRIELFGECKRGEGENVRLFYGKLRNWLDRDV